MHTCTLPAPSARNSAASRQVVTPPIPLIGMRDSAGSRAISATMFSAMGFTAGPQYPPCAPFPSIVGSGANRSRSTDVIELMVFIRLTASAPPRIAASAGWRMSVMFGVSLTITGMRVAALTQRVTISIYSGTCPTAAPMPRSDIPWGHPKFSSTPSAPVSSTNGRMNFHGSSSHGTISDTIIAWSG